MFPVCILQWLYTTPDKPKLLAQEDQLKDTSEHDKPHIQRNAWAFSVFFFLFDLSLFFPFPSSSPSLRLWTSIYRYQVHLSFSGFAFCRHFCLHWLLLILFLCILILLLYFGLYYFIHFFSSLSPSHCSSPFSSFYPFPSPSAPFPTPSNLRPNKHWIFDRSQNGWGRDGSAVGRGDFNEIF